MNVPLQQAVALASSGRIAEAIPLFRAAARQRPRDPAIRFDLANALRLSGRLPEAAAEYQRAVKLAPEFRDARMNLALVCCELARWDQAVANARAILRVDPAHAGAVTVLSMALRTTGDPDTLRQLDALLPRLLSAPVPPEEAGWRHHFALATICAVLGRRREAVDHYRAAAALPQALCRALRLKDEACDWRDRDGLVAAALDAACRDPASAEPFRLLSLTDDPALLRAVAVANAPRRRHLALAAPMDARRLRIGYLSADFHAHATAFLLTEVLEHHDHDRFDIRLYSYGPADRSAWRQRLERCGTFVDLRGLSDAEGAARIAADSLDVLVELKGFTQDHRLGITAHRPARTVVNWLGFPGTLGMPAVDYVLADAVVAPSSAGGDFSEAVVRLPVVYQPSGRDRAAGATDPVDRPSARVVLGSFNNPYKIAPEVFAVWCRLLADHPDTALWLYAPSEEARANLAAEARARGVDPSRLAFAGRAAPGEHLGRYRHVSLHLDTWPYTGHTTTSDALLMGCPVLTVAGRGFASRVAASLVTAAGLPDMACPSLAAYEDKARELLARPERLREIRASLADGAARLFEPGRFARELEFAYAEMARRARAGEPAADFDVPLGGLA